MGPGPIPDTQNPDLAPYFIGRPAELKPLPKKDLPAHTLAPLSHLHNDIGNTDVSDFPGPTGRNPLVKSYFLPGVSGMKVDSQGRLTANAGVAAGFVALDPDNFRIRGSFSGPSGNRFNVYDIMDAEGRIVAPSNGNSGQQITIIERKDQGVNSQFSATKRISLRAVLQPDEQLFGVFPDVEGNLWFVTGGIQGYSPGVLPDYTTVGHIEKDGAIVTHKIPGEIVENGFSVDGTTAFIVTSSALYAFEKLADGTIHALWRQSYPSENRVKKGGFALGSGASVTLMGEDYIAITDNAENQVNLLIINRKRDWQGERVICSVPLFAPGASALDVSPIALRNADGGHSAILANVYNTPFMFHDLNKLGAVDADYNNLSTMGSGLTRVDLLPDGKRCEVKWEAAVKSPAVYKLSTATGLIYGYFQDPGLAQQGTYIWYFTGIDFETGEEVFKVRAGAGALKNVGLRVLYLLPDGRLVAPTLGGLVTLQDGPYESEG